MVSGNEKLVWPQISNSFNADVCSKVINNTGRRLGVQKLKQINEVKSKVTCKLIILKKITIKS